MGLAEVLAPAIHYAENGYPLVSKITNALQAVESLFRNEWPSSSEIYFPKPGRPKPGDLFRNPAPAATYRRVLGESEAAGGDRERQHDAAQAAWSEGVVARAGDRYYTSSQDNREREGEGQGG